MYPAGDTRIAVRRVTVGRGIGIRVLESGDPAGHPVLLVHGWAACAYTWSDTIPALAAVGLRAIALDLPGHGLSDKPADEEQYSTDALCQVILSVAHALSLDRFSFVGHSLGGSLGLELAVRGERRLDRLALLSAVGLAVSPFIFPLRWLSPSFVNRIAPMLVTRTAVTAVLHVAFASRQRPTERDIEEYWAPSQFDGYARACRACAHRAKWRPQRATRLRSLRLPVLVLSGRRDRLVRGTIERGRLIPSARVVSIRDAGHVVQQDAPEAVNAELVEFFRNGGPGRRRA